MKTILRLVFLFVLALPVFAQPYYISPGDNDKNPGTLAKPFVSLQRAQQAVRQQPGGVFLRGGTYYLPATLVFTAQDSGTQDAPVIFQNYENEKPVISGGVKLENLDYDFGVQKPELKAIARTPELPLPKNIAAAAVARDTAPRAWLGASIRNIADEGEMSAFGLPGVTGILVLEVSAAAPLAKSGLGKNDVILSVNGNKTDDIVTLLRQVPSFTAEQTIKIGISRLQKEITLTLTP